MPLPDEYKLDNPAWYALKETHQLFAEGDDLVKRYNPDIVLFVAYDTSLEKSQGELDKWISPGESFFIIGDLNKLPPAFTIDSRLDCLQMICTKAINLGGQAPAMEKLGPEQAEQMFTLINKVQPGYYLPGTRQMGDYFGILQEGHLVSMAGERMRMDLFTEISAVVTDPNFTGRRYAQHLIAHLVNKNLTAGIVPFLHTSITNERAIKIYEHLGFIYRRIIPFWKIKRVK